MPKNYLFVGGSHGIAATVVSELLKTDADLYCLCREQGSLPVHPQLHYIPFDATQSNGFAVVLPEILDGYAYFPGTVNLRPFKRFTKEDFLKDYELNVWGAVNVLQNVLPQLKRSPQASVIFFSSVAAQLGIPFHTLVSASKGAVEGLVRSLAAELAPKIRVNAIAPSLTDTPLADSFTKNEKLRQDSVSRHPLKRIGQPQDIAQMVIFLLSNQSSWITGQVFKVDGGFSSLR